MRRNRFRSAFTMLELVFVIVILGIVASIGSELVVKVYESYITQRAEYRATQKTELAALQIANRLSSAIPGTVFRIDNGGNYESVQSPLTQVGTNYIGLQWVGSDSDSFSASATPGWSGFCDVNSTFTVNPTISTLGSNLGFANTVRTNLAGGAAPAFNPTLFFPSDTTAYPVSAPLAGTTLSFPGITPPRVIEHYKLAWSSYTLVVENGDLNLYYNFSPVPQAPYANAPSSLIMENVSSFKFKGSGRTLRFKICKQEQISENVNENITACKEKAVF